MPNYKLLLEYDGSHFFGWQVQPGLRTVQGELEEAVHTLTKERVRIQCAGRTDRGVHALGQVANFRLNAEWPPEKIQHALNGITGKDIAVLQVDMVSDDFHARFDARARQYIYYLSLRPVAVGRQYTFFCKFDLDLDAMQEAAGHLYGEHHFEAFAQKDPDEQHYLSRIEDIEWIREGERIGFRIRANRFLHNMVRLIMGTLIQVGRGKISPQEFKNILASRSRDHIGFKAPAHGLFLEKVYY